MPTAPNLETSARTASRTEIRNTKIDGGLRRMVSPREANSEQRIVSTQRSVGKRVRRPAPLFAIPYPLLASSEGLGGSRQGGSSGLGLDDEADGRLGPVGALARHPAGDEEQAH